MRRSVALTAAGIVWLLLLPPVLLNASSQASDTLLVGVHYAPPLSYRGPDGSIDGFCIDLFNVIAAENHWPVRYVFDTWPNTLAGLNLGKLDFILPILKTDERALLYDFSEIPMFVTWASVITNSSHEINSFLDLKGLCIGGVKDDVFFIRLTALLDGFAMAYSVEVFDESSDLYKALERGRVDAAAIERMDFHINRRQYNVVPTPIVFSPGTARVGALKKAHPELLKDFDRTLEILKEDPSSAYHELYERWFGNTNPRRLPRWLITAMEIGGTVLIFLMGTVLIFRHRLRRRTAELSAKNRQMEQEIADRIDAENGLQQALKEKTVLLKEVHHRVNNNLQIISSLLNLQANRLEDEESRWAFGESRRRVQTIALAHQILMKSSDLAHINAAAFFKELVGKVLKSHSARTSHIEKHMDIQVPSLNIDQAIPCGLIVNELTGYAMKHIQSHSADMPCSLGLSLKHDSDEGWLVLCASYQGVPFSEETPLPPSGDLGMNLIWSLAEEQLDGRIEYSRIGTDASKFEIHFPAVLSQG